MWSGKTKMIGFQHVEIFQSLERREEEEGGKPGRSAYSG
jgi:hypothetical protein